jgi:hypothetical protein
MDEQASVEQGSDEQASTQFDVVYQAKRSTLTEVVKKIVRVNRKFILGADHTTAVLRGHAHIDDLLSILILRHAPYAEAFIPLKKTSFSRKVQILYKMNVFDLQTLKLINRLNSLRNKFAHDLEIVRITSTDDEDFEQLICEPFSGWYESALEMLLNKTGGRQLVLLC